MAVGGAMDLSFSLLYSALSLPFASLGYRGVMYVMFPWGAPDDWHEPPGRQADWLAGRSSPTRGLDMDDTYTLISPPPHTFVHWYTFVIHTDPIELYGVLL